ncbi:hypothetical protein EVAR_66787_1 [Eumeta japonica]|uniref:Uncharacterized protein n=1 Tax=Eumeta variegata TaxID=151549 RepID=A0A4C1ZIH9_EUMVA|nr:hypothetical protein EVAR_66787_1 [Eumeta japonica]
MVEAWSGKNKPPLYMFASPVFLGVSRVILQYQRLFVVRLSDVEFRQTTIHEILRIPKSLLFTDNPAFHPTRELDVTGGVPRYHRSSLELMIPRYGSLSLPDPPQILWDCRNKPCDSLTVPGTLLG